MVPYWGSPQERKVLRHFWDQTNLHKKSASFHIVVTSYQVRIYKLLKSKSHFRKLYFPSKRVYLKFPWEQGLKLVEFWDILFWKAFVRHRFYFFAAVDRVWLQVFQSDQVAVHGFGRGPGHQVFGQPALEDAPRIQMPQSTSPLRDAHPGPVTDTHIYPFFLFLGKKTYLRIFKICTQSGFTAKASLLITSYFFCNKYQSVF